MTNVELLQVRKVTKKSGKTKNYHFFNQMICSILKSLAVVRRENTSASNVFVFVCVFSSLPPALCTAAAFYLSGKQSGLSELAGHVWYGLT